MTGTALIPVAAIAHSTLGASVAKRWMNCPGSVRLSREHGMDDEQTLFAKIGTVAHEIAATCLKEGREPIEFLERFVEVGGTKIEVDEEMVEGVQLYVDFVRAEYKPDEGDIIFIEHRFSLAELNPPEPMFGTTDVAIFKPRLSLLKTIDFKYGYVFVDANENDQLRYYALGACLALKDYDIRDVEAWIVQPRSPSAQGPIRHEKVTAFELIEWSSRLMEQAAETQKPGAAFASGEWCRFCPARGICPELRKTALAVAQAGFDDGFSLDTSQVPDPTMMTPEQVSRVMDAAGYLKQWFSAVYARGFQLMQHGVVIPNWKLVPTKGRAHWVSEDPTDTATHLMLDFGMTEEQIYEKRLRSPAQIKKQVRGKGSGKVKEKITAELVVTKSSGMTLARLDDPRPALDASGAAGFEPLPEEE